MDSKAFEEMCYQFMVLKYEYGKAENDSKQLAFNKGCVAAKGAFERAFEKYKKRYAPIK